MNTGVYINDREACSKASDGVSAAAFPDPCWTPPAPPVVVPYPNTSRSSTLSNDTTTVFICNSMVAKEDRSFFATSTGNEGATQGMSKGLMTGVIKGKSYFQSWSPNVRFEGRGVPRHLDIMGHNQRSFASNTPLFPYVSTGIFDKDECEKERKKIERECAKDEDKSEEKRFLGNKRKRANQDKPPKAKNGEWHWTDDHCTGFERTLVKGDGLAESLTENDIDFDRLKEELGTIKDHIADLREHFNLLQSAEDELKDMAVNAATKAAAKLAAKAALKQAAGSVVPLVGNVSMGLWTLYDFMDTASEIIEITSFAE
ncbi:PAAR-like domain-containing protein [Thorsellia kenyensis]|uniref:PAAR-like domain-containing protein n=1 Tax=Thorsellia kenyensis TaxID=1549888 RepID=A0ABV6C6D5_9GAMM